MCVLKKQFNLKVFVGCCRTNDEFIKGLSKMINKSLNTTNYMN